MILFTRQRIRSVRAVVVGVAVSCFDLSAVGQQTQLAAQSMTYGVPRVTVTSELSVGNLYRHGTAIVDKRSAQAAQYEVRGLKGRWARLSVYPLDLRSDRGSDRMSLHIEPSDCALSIDGGTTWRPFSSGLLHEDLMFPTTSDRLLISVVLVRIGASVTCDVLQSRGDYHGGIMLLAEYLPDQDNMIELFHR